MVQHIVVASIQVFDIFVFHWGKKLMTESDISLAFLCYIPDRSIIYKISVPKYNRALRPTVLYLPAVLCLIIAHVLLTVKILPKFGVFLLFFS